MRYPALDIAGADPDFLLAFLDDYSPAAVDDSSTDRMTVYFSNTSERDLARDGVAAAFPAAVVSAREVDDENWARRSQENLRSIVVGRITVAPPWDASKTDPAELSPASSAQSPVPHLQIVISPSMGFGTGHHATTRLCLAALQDIDLRGKTMLDVGTGSGVLAIAARLLGAHSVIGLDHDRDAIQSADENLALNPAADDVAFRTIDLREETLRPSDVVTANLTGALLVASGPLLTAAVRPGGTLILSGVQAHERAAVVEAFGAERLIRERQETDWVGLTFLV